MSAKGYPKLFIPGPTHVTDEILRAQTKPMIGHRAPEYAELHARVKSLLPPLFGTGGHVYVVTSSGTGLQEAAVRNCVRDGKKCLNLVCGAFGARWHKVTLANGKEGVPLEVPWGEAVKPGMVADALKKEDYDAVTVVFNETSTGVINPLPEIAEAVRAHPETLLMVDAVSCAGGVEIRFDDWGLDVCLTSSQKALALPPGLALCAVSDRALERAAGVSNRGVYFDFLDIEKYDRKNQTPSTPAISLMQSLLAGLEAIEREGWDARFARHIEMAATVQGWAARRFELFAEEGYRSPTVTAIRNNREIDVSALNKFLRERGMLISDGYGVLKGKTFRIAHMGDIRQDDLQILIAAIEEFLGVWRVLGSRVG